MKIRPWMIGSMLERADFVLPNEACGVFTGTHNGPVAVQHLANVHHDPTRAFRLDPDQTLRVYQEAESQGLKVIGTWHSHPTQAPVPSQLDKNGLQHPDLSFHVILGRCVVANRNDVRLDCHDVRLYDRKWDELDQIDVPALPFLTLEG